MKIRQQIEELIDFKGINWEDIENHYPNYSQCNEITYLDILTRYLDGEDVSEEDMMQMGNREEAAKDYVRTYEYIIHKTLENIA